LKIRNGRFRKGDGYTRSDTILAPGKFQPEMKCRDPMGS
jgi:hypothetical protein